MPGVGLTIEHHVFQEGSVMTSLTVERLRAEGAGFPVAGSLSMMLRRNLWVYRFVTGAYDLIYVQFFEKDNKPSSWQHPDAPGRRGVYPVKKTNAVWHVGSDDQKVRRFQMPLVPGLSSTIHVTQGAEMSPIIKLDKMTTPTMVFVGITRSKRSNKCLIMPCDTFDFRVFSTGVPPNQNNELLLAHLRGDVDFETNLAEYHRRANSTKPKADPRSVSSSRALAGQSGDRKRKSEGGQNGDRQRKREGGQNGLNRSTTFQTDTASLARRTAGPYPKA
jgi:hypothetical protein